MDALIIGQELSQFNDTHVDRELLKAYVAFKPHNDLNKTIPICTGNWGCVSRI